MNRRPNLAAILDDPASRKRLVIQATAFLIGVGSDFDLEYEEALARAEAAHEDKNDNQ